MSFDAPLMLLGLPLVWLIWHVGDRVEAALNSLFAPEVFAKLAHVESTTLLSRWRRPLFYLALAWFVVALAKPMLPTSPSNIKPQGADILIALDFSSLISGDDRASMRLMAAKERIKAMLDEGNGDRFGLLGCSRTPFVISPITSDRATLHYFVESLSNDGSQGGDIGVLFPLVAKMANNTPRILVILSHSDRTISTNEIELAKQMGVSVYAIDLAALDENEDRLSHSSLKELCMATGGRYEVASAGDVTRIFEAIRERVEAQRAHDVSLIDEVQLFSWPLLIGIILLFLSRFEMPSLPWKQAGVILLLIAAPHSEAGWFDFYHLSKAQSAWVHGRYKEAALLYEKLAASHPDDALLYNLGASYYKLGAYEKALATWGRIRRSDTAFVLAQAAMGNAYALRGEYHLAQQAYQESLERLPSAAVAHNLEIAKKLEEEYQQSLARLRQMGNQAAQTTEAKQVARAPYPNLLLAYPIDLVGSEGIKRKSSANHEHRLIWVVGVFGMILGGLLLWMTRRLALKLLGKAVWPLSARRQLQQLLGALDKPERYEAALEVWQTRRALGYRRWRALWKQSDSQQECAIL